MIDAKTRFRDLMSRLLSKAAERERARLEKSTALKKQLDTEISSLTSEIYDLAEPADGMTKYQQGVLDGEHRYHGTVVAWLDWAISHRADEIPEDGKAAVSWVAHMIHGAVPEDWASRVCGALASEENR